MTKGGLIVGASLPQRVVEVDVSRMKAMALLLRDPNPIHWDVDVNRRLGLGDLPINQGPITMSYLIELAVQSAGGRERIKHMKFRFLGNVFAGQTVVCTGSVTALDEAAGYAELELVGSVDGEAVITGVATVELPD